MYKILIFKIVNSAEMSQNASANGQYHKDFKCYRILECVLIFTLRLAFVTYDLTIGKVLGEYTSLYVTRH